MLCCVVSQRYSKMKAIHNTPTTQSVSWDVVLYPKDTQKWKQFTTFHRIVDIALQLCCIPKILKNESNSQLVSEYYFEVKSCVVSQRYSKMKAIHNDSQLFTVISEVVLYPKDTQKWKQFTTSHCLLNNLLWLCCIPKILKNESNSQRDKQ